MYVFIGTPLNVHILINGLVRCLSEELYAPLPLDTYIVPSASQPISDVTAE